MDMNYGGRWMDLLPLMIQVSPACELQKTCPQKWRSTFFAAASSIKTRITYCRRMTRPG
jgi:hypothetical protein